MTLLLGIIRITDPDFPYGRPGIAQAVNQCRQDQQTGDVNTNAPEEKYGSEHDQKTEMPDGIGVIGPEFFAHRDDHRAAEQADQSLNNHDVKIGQPEFSEVPRLKISKEDIGFA